MNVNVFMYLGRNHEFDVGLWYLKKDVPILMTWRKDTTSEVFSSIMKVWWMDGWMDGWMGGWVNGWMDGWLGGWVNGWMNGCINELVDGWTDGRLERQTGISLISWYEHEKMLKSNLF